MKVIPYGHQWLDEKDIKEVVKVLRSDRITQGPKIREFEEALSAYTGAKYAVSVSSGTAALHIACLAAGIRPGDEAITSPLTFAASANCILYCGGRPVFADIESDTMNIDPEEIKKKITMKTKAVIPVHFSGYPPDLEKIAHIARMNSLLVIEDAAHALGARYKGSKIGSCKYSDMTIFSFHPVKSITTGEGGAVLTNDRKLYEKLLIFRNHGIVKNKTRSVEPWRYDMKELGFNYRITDIQSALGISQLAKLDKFIARRKEIVKVYEKAFKGNIYFDIPTEKEYGNSSYHLYPIRLKDGGFKDRKKEIFLKMKEASLGVQVHYIPVYLHSYYRKLGFRKGECPKAEDCYTRLISIPIYPALKNAQVKYIVSTVFDIFNKLN